MAEANTSTELEVQEKQEVAPAEEQTTQGRFYTPLTDIFESGEALTVVMEIPGVDRDDVTVKVEKDVLEVEARISLSPYEDMRPLYTEYGIGHYARKFRLSNAIDREGIRAAVADGVLTLTLPKVQAATARKIDIQ